MIKVLSLMSYHSQSFQTPTKRLAHLEEFSSAGSALIKEVLNNAIKSSFSLVLSPFSSLQYGDVGIPGIVFRIIFIVYFFISARKDTLIYRIKEQMQRIISLICSFLHFLPEIEGKSQYCQAECPDSNNFILLSGKIGLTALLLSKVSSHL